MEYILVIDTGSSSMRGILFDHRGKMNFTEQRYYAMQTHGDAAEYNPDDFQKCLIEICRACSDWCSGNKNTIEAISFTSQRSSILPVTSAGKPLCQIITWYDKRASDICREMNHAHGADLYDLSGMRTSPVLSAPKIAWLRKNMPKIYESAYKIIGIQDYLIFLATGRFVTDTSLASRSHMMNIHTKQWDDALLNLYGVDRSKLADLVEPCSIVGSVNASFSQAAGLAEGTPVIAGGGDQQCSALGQGLLKPGEIGITCGSGAYLVTVNNHPLLDPDRRMNVSAAISPEQWVIEANTLSSGTVQDWLLRTFYDRGYEQDGPIAALCRDAQHSPPGAKNLIMLPDLAGKGCPDWNDDARGAFLNITFEHERCDFARAMIEGLAAEIADCFDALRRLLPEITSVSVTGGLTKNVLFDQILADMIDFPVKICFNKETTAIGAYMSALYALSISSMEDAYQLFPQDTRPQIFLPDRSSVAYYQQINAQRRSLYRSLYPYA